jgi:heme/copper-type cytochrome/quinol oxidase subunit 4
LYIISILVAFDVINYYSLYINYVFIIIAAIHLIYCIKDKNYENITLIFIAIYAIIQSIIKILYNEE